jgi:hypothetical protein
MLKPFILALALFATPALAQQPAAPPPDPNTPITLTLGELNDVIRSQTTPLMADNAALKAASVFQKIQAQIAPKSDEPPKPVEPAK